ncbi:peptidase domain-containing ABC transporter [Yersinia kristensenii]|uniref:peptidase domain-containing ABC transporter n=2 Tax=Yersinia kristensenii TaxID=28152 RepID=UPI000C155B18|nr:peptidase domain-containing ABC transporter [Yersinia kristensenii]MDA5522288.1 peptidase domain-containing ABC transporter [Yersinia kristensenii]MDR4895870.1 peptidase domain-containing ABC transporter [Yersinia kristensenii]MDX6736150.1 peptidase domain-containing ABC transporter [Yersinia kristensenii]PHZ34939.1 ABC transporter ATP-binding protein [Yersinia kristensenii]
MIIAMKGYFEALRQRLPVMMQTEATECGLACMAMIAGYYGLNMDLQALRKHYQVSLKGMSLRDLIVLADRLSLGSRPVRADLDSARQLKTPCILHWSFNHFVVLKKFSRHGATIIDPAKGERKISLTELSQHFTGIALEIWPNPHFQRRTEKKTIRLLDMFKNVSGLSRALAHILTLSFCIELLAMAVPLAAQFILDMALRSGDINLVSLITWGIIALLIFRALLSLVRAWMVMSIKYTLGIQWNSGLFSHLIRLPVSYFEKRHIGDVRSRFNSLSVVQDAFTADMVASLLNIVVVIGLFFLMWAYDSYLAAVTTVLISLTYAAIKFFLFSAYRSANLEAIAHEAKQQSHFLETVRGIEVKDLSYRYGDGEPAVFEHVSLSIKAGESIAIVGPSGCGKSTLLKCMGGLVPQKCGSILFDGVDAHRLGLDAYRKHIAYVLQEDKLFAGSLLDNISSFDIHPDSEWALECARLASIHTEIDAMPMKYETRVGDMGSALSGGQRQRVSLARALYKRPRILFLDEATSDLDIDNEARINDAIRALKITRIFVAHRPTMIAMADRVFDLSKNAEIEMEKESPYVLFTQ